MSTTLFIDANGSAVIPSALLQILGLKPGARLEAEVSPQGIALKPAREKEGIQEVTPEEKAMGLRLVRKGRGLVIEGGEPFSAVEALQAAREERDETILAYRNNCP